MPWLPEVFTAPVMEQILDRRRRDALVAVPYFDGLLVGDPDPLVESFAGEPEVHDPVRGRVRGVAAFRAFVTETSAWLRDHHASVDDGEHVILEQHGFEEVVLRLDTDAGALEVPIVVVADREVDGRIDEVRVYFDSRVLTGRHGHRPPLLQADADLREPDVVGAYQRALATGDVDAVLETFEPGGSMREPAGDAYLHRGADELRALYERFFSNGGGIRLERCAVTDDGRSCALEYNVVAWGRTALPPEAGLAVYVRGDSGKLAAARVYDDAEPPLA